MPLITAHGKSVVPTVIADNPADVDPSRLVGVTNSATGETVHYFESATVETANKACDAAQSAFQGESFTGGWKRVIATERRDILLRAAALFGERAAELKEVQKRETSCDDFWATNNVVTTVKYIKEAAACITQIRGHVRDINVYLKHSS